MNQLPSVSIEEGKKILLSINKTLTVLNVFDVNEDESCIDILFEPQLEWFDKSLTFKFLKYSETENTLDENFDKIWKHEPNYKVIRTTTESDEDQIFISRKNLPTLAIDEIGGIYPGQSNNLNLVKVKIFICSSST